MKFSSHGINDAVLTPRQHYRLTRLGKVQMAWASVCISSYITLLFALSLLWSLGSLRRAKPESAALQQLHRHVLAPMLVSDRKWSS